MRVNDQSPLKFLLFSRCMFLLILIASLNHLVGFEISLVVPFSGVCLGTLFALTIFKRKMHFIGFLLSLISILTFCWIIYGLIGKELLSTLSSRLFLFDLLKDSLSLFNFFFAISSISTWFFIRVPGAGILELISIISLCIFGLSDHRDFHLDQPKIVSDIAWIVNIEPLSAFLLCGICILLFTIFYLWLIVKWELSFITQETYSKKEEPSRKNIIFKRITALSALVISCFLIWQSLFNFYDIAQSNRVTNGVGQEKSPGLSPLGFHSALGSTNQPAAIVRLDGDYSVNPFTPMLYLRENALSTLSGTEFVVSAASFDTDLHRTSPSESFIIDSTASDLRKRLSLAAYLLADHSLAFAMDFPISIQPLKNPKPERFKGAFQAISLVPVFPISSLDFRTVGDPSWPAEVMNHYLETNTDPRYRILAEQITVNAQTSIAKAFAITKYLSENSIYTLSPNHSTMKGEDQTAPYLFGDFRGYCVHFAHATVFMLRSLGIPARIGTGYLTDLSKAKDGHILLRMSDRHAWAEVYVSGIGWVPFDIKPQHVESHADSEIDQKLLEELMGMLGEDEISLPPEKNLNEPGLISKSDSNWAMPDIAILPILASILGIFTILKIYIRYSYLLPSSKRTKIKRKYRSIVAKLADIGITRELAETREEFAKRLSFNVHDDSFTNLSTKILAVKYGDITVEDYEKFNSYLAQYFTDTIVTRIVSILSPISVYLFLRNRW